MTLRRSLVLAVLTIVAWSWSVSAGVEPKKASADPAALKRFVALLVPTKSTIHQGQTVAYARHSDVPAYGRIHKPLSRWKP